MEENKNVPSILNEESLVVLAKASEVLQRNQTTVSKASESGAKLIEQIKATGMTAAIDEQCNGYLVKVNQAIAAMNERRSPITQLFTQVAKQFTSLEGELKDGKIRTTIQQFRNEFAASEAKKKKEAADEAARLVKVENEKVTVRQKVETDLNVFFEKQLQTVSNHLLNLLNNSTLENIEKNTASIKAFPVDYEKTKYMEFFSATPVSMLLTKEEVRAILDSVMKGSFASYRKTYYETIDDLKINLDAKVPAKKRELEALAVASVEEAKKIQADAEGRKIKEDLEQSIAAEKRVKDAEIAATATAEAAKMNNLFNAAAIIPDQSKAQVRASLKIKVTHQSAWVEIFTYYMQNEGLTLGVDELGKKSLNQMKAYCEKIASKDGELIKSKYLMYEEDFTAVNKA